MPKVQTGIEKLIERPWQWIAGERITARRISQAALPYRYIALLLGQELTNPFILSASQAPSECPIPPR